jgi:hypothetical protein
VIRPLLIKSITPLDIISYSCRPSFCGTVGDSGMRPSIFDIIVVSIGELSSVGELSSISVVIANGGL